MLAVLCAICVLAGSCYASPIANHYLETVLNTALKNEIRGLKLDPAMVQDFNTQFEDKLPIIGKVKGLAEYTKGSLTGLSGVRRFSECQGPYYNFGAKSLNCTISFNRLNINYDGKLKYGKTPKVSIKGHAEITNTIIFIEVSSQGQGMPGSLKNFLFQNMGFMNIKFTGLGPLNKFTKFLEDGYRYYVESQIFNSVSQRFQYALNRALLAVPLPN